MLALDVLLLIMIVVCIVYCWILNQRIRDLHNSRVEFARMIKEFDHAVVKAEGCISELSSLGSSATLQIKNAVSNADELVDEIKTINDFGKNISYKLEKYISEAKDLVNDLAISIEMASSTSKSKRKTASVKTSSAKASAAKSKKQSNFENLDFENAEMDFEEDLLPEQQNLLKTVLSKITTHKHNGTMDQNSFYNSLKKVSVK